eukprot:9892196-Alexandrium_andersonii.AAC.1
MAKAWQASDVTTGGHWIHLQCIPGGLRVNDVAETPDEDPIPQIGAVIVAQAARGPTAPRQPPAATS